MRRRALAGGGTPDSTQPQGPNWIISETTSPVDYRPQIAALTTARASSQDAPSSLAIHCRAQRTELIISTTGSWKQATDGEVKVVYRINEEPPVEQRWRPAQTGRSLRLSRATSFASCAQCRIAARFSLKCTLEKLRRMKARLNWSAWIPSDVRSRRRATGPSPDRRVY